MAASRRAAPDRDPAPGVELFPELPVAGEGPNGELLNGVIDLLVRRGDDLALIDYKTDAPPAGRVDDLMPAYAAQLRAYAHLVRSLPTFHSLSLRLALLFTADGSIHDIDD